MVNEETYNVPLNAICLSPCTHDEGIIVCNDSHNIDALSLDRGEVLNVARKVPSAAARSECTRDGEEDDFLVGPFCTSS